MDSKKISECMKRNMKKNNITAQALAAKTGISVERIEEYMSGDFVPKAFELELIAHEISVPLISLIHGGGWIHYYMKDEYGRTVCKWEEY